MANYERIRISVMGMIKNPDNSILMVFKRDGPEPNRWDLPGGGLQPGERVKDALKREMLEETGLSESSFHIGEVIVISEDFFPEWKGKGLHSISIIYSCQIIDEYELSTNDLSEIGEIKWINPIDMPRENLSTRSYLTFQKADFV